jgi:hypothetical protein
MRVQRVTRPATLAAAAQHARRFTCEKTYSGMREYGSEPTRLGPVAVRGCSDITFNPGPQPQCHAAHAKARSSGPCSDVARTGPLPPHGPTPAIARAEPRRRMCCEECAEECVAKLEMVERRARDEDARHACATARPRREQPQARDRDARTHRTGYRLATRER